MVSSIKRLIVGEPISTAQGIHERLSKRIALAVFSSDAISSTAYATEEILLVLATAATATNGASFGYVIPVSIAIAILLWIVGISYRQTIHAYPSGGGAYIVAKDNLGQTAGLIAAASLLVDYILTVSVSISAGVAAITSAAQGTSFAWLADHRVFLCIGAIMIITIANLRGVRESGMLFSIPTYVFIFSFLGMIVWGLFHYFVSGGVKVPLPPPSDMAFAEGYNINQNLHVFLLLGAFANGCTALTGVEAISNGIPAFKKPESENAATTLIWMVITLTVMFLGTSLLASLYGVHPRQSETVISQFARAIFTGYLSWFYYVVQAATAAILVLAANTSFADFPRLASLLARDRFLPIQLANQGDRLVFSNGIIILAVFSSALVWLFQGDTSRLIPLYAVGVFLSFTLSQAGMVKHWLRLRDQNRVSEMANQARMERTANPREDMARTVNAVIEIGGWRKSIVINALGALVSAAVLVIFILTKFVHGAWIVVILIPAIVLMFREIHSHYMLVAKELSFQHIEPLHVRHNTAVVPISGVTRAVAIALEYAKSISDDVRAIYVEIDPSRTDQIKEQWRQLQTGFDLTIIPSPYRSLIRPMLNYIDIAATTCGNNMLTIVLPEFIPAHWWQNFLHNRTAFLIKGALLFRPGIVVANVPYHLKH